MDGIVCTSGCRTRPSKAELVKEIDRLLAEKEARLKANRAKAFPNSAVQE